MTRHTTRYTVLAQGSRMRTFSIVSLTWLTHIAVVRALDGPLLAALS